MLNRARLWLRSLVLRRRLEREMREEMAEHLERSTARLVARGLPPEEARREALREFGNVAYLQEEGRIARGAGWVDALVADARFALRQFVRRPAATLTMFVVLSVGMGIGTLLFSYVHSYAVLPPVGIRLEDDLVRIRGSQDAGVYGRGSRFFSDEEFQEYRELTGHFRAVAGWTDAAVALSVGESVERRGLQAKGSFVTEGYFPTLGVRPVLGTGLPAPEPGDPATAAVAVIGYAVWDQLFGRSPEAIGSTVVVNGVPLTVVGVAPEGFVGVGWLTRLTVWMPLEARRLVMPGAVGGFRAAGRLHPGVAPEEATAAARVVAARAASDEGAPAEFRPVDPSTEVVPLLSANGDPMFQRDVRLMTLLVGLLGLLVLAVTCTNVSALLTGLAAARRQEIAVRLSLGAARGRLIRQLLTESALLASLAAAAALGLVGLALHAANSLIPVMPMEMGVTWPAAAFTFGVALAVGVLFGLSPALHATRLAIASALRDSAASIAAARGRLQRGLVVAQIAFTQPLIVLLAAALLAVLGGYEAQRRGELLERLVQVSVRLPSPVTGPSVAPDPETTRELRATLDRVADRLRAAPGVEAVVMESAESRPLGAYRVHPADRGGGGADDAVRLSGRTAGAGYFGAMEVPVVRGREFGPGDVAPAEPGAEVPVVVGRDLARRLWPGADPVGRRLRAATDTASGARTLAVVGVIEDPGAGSRDPEEAYPVYLPPDTGRAPTGMVVRTAAPAGPLLPVIRGIVQEETPGMLSGARSLAEIEEEGRRTSRLIAGGVLGAGLMALLLSAIGLYAVVAFSVGQRTGEIAVRLAVGARARQIVQRFVADGLRLSALGLVIGLPAGVLGVRALLSAADGIRPVSMPLVTLIAALGVVAVATTASWIPARRAALVDPAVALRRE